MAELICAHCGGAIHGSYYSLRGLHWHAEHFFCAACGRPIPGTFYTDPFGNPYCGDQPDRHRKCRFCFRVLRETPSHGEDRCPECLAVAVILPGDAQNRFIHAARWSRANEMSFPRNVRLRVEIVSSQVLLENNDHGTWAPLGIAYTRSTTRSGVRTGDVDKIQIERSLPTPLFESVAVHELGHAWLSVIGVFNAPRWAEEGFCKLIEHRWLRDQHQPDADRFADGIERDADPVYGDGYRYLASVAQTVGFRNVIAGVQRDRVLPGVSTEKTWRQKPVEPPPLEPPRTLTVVLEELAPA